MSEEKFPPKEVKNHAPSYSTKNKFFIRANLPPQLNSTSTLFDSLNSFPSIPEIPEIYIHPKEETFDTRYSKVQKEKKKNQKEKSRNNTRQINGKRKSFSQPSFLPSFDYCFPLEDRIFPSPSIDFLIRPEVEDPLRRGFRFQTRPSSPSLRILYHKFNERSNALLPPPPFFLLLLFMPNGCHYLDEIGRR